MTVCDDPKGEVTPNILTIAVYPQLDELTIEARVIQAFGLGRVVIGESAKSATVEGAIKLLHANLIERLQCKWNVDPCKEEFHVEVLTLSMTFEDGLFFKTPDPV